MIVHEVDRRGMPSELALLPFVESAFDPDVFSHAGAAGLWQFIPDTGRRYGLQQAKYYDARMDPFAATGAALNYLQKLNNDFNGDWLLALAAYNCGENRVQREIDRNRAKGLPTTFWHLSLPKETREYVPRLLAFKELIGNAQRYGITLPDTPNRARLAQLQVDKPVNLREVAVQAGLDPSTLLSLNPCFRTGITTPEYSNRIVLPRQYADQLVQIIEAAPPAASSRVYASKSSSGYNKLATTRIGKKHAQYAKAKTRSRVHTVRRGDTLQSIAQKHGTTVQALMKRNSKRSSKVLVGERLNVIAAVSGETTSS
jgi:membrane-bound lytic murein transglycosylase D